MHKYNCTIYYRDTDSGGIVYHPNYLSFAESARIEYLQSLGFTQKHLREDLHCQFVVRHCVVDYHASARLEDELTVCSHVDHVKRTSMTFHQSIYRDDQLLTTIRIVIVCINDDGRPIRIPEGIVQALEDKVQE